MPHVTLTSIANNPDIRDGLTRAQIDAAIAKRADTELPFDKPYEDKKRVRVAGRFTVESLAPHRVAASDDEDRPASERVVEQAQQGSSYEQTIFDNLRKAGVQNGAKAERIVFDTLEPYAGRWVQGVGEYLDAEGYTRRVGISLGPQYGTVGQERIKEAAKEAVRGVGCDLLLVCGFAFDSRADETAREFAPDADSFAATQGQQTFGRLPVLLVRMNPDLAMSDALLRSTGAGNLFTVFGEPDVTIEPANADDRGNPGDVVVEIHGLDVYDPTTGAVRASSTDDIAMWMVDTAHDGESFFVRHAYFTGAEDPYKRLKQALRSEIDENAWATLHATRSRPFARPARGRVAVKVINHYGDEVLKVYSV